MKNLIKRTRFAIYILLTCVILVSCSKFTCDWKMYSEAELKSLSINDSVYVENLGQIVGAVVLKNDTIKYVLKLKRASALDDTAELTEWFKYSEMP